MLEIGVLLKKQLTNNPSILLLPNIFRMGFSLAFVFAVINAGHQHLILFIANYFILYLYYTVFDITSLMANLRPQNKG